MRGSLLTCSEYTEPGFHIKEVTDRLLNLPKRPHGLLLITKDIARSKPIYKVATEIGLPTITHVTITGLGGTPVEPTVPNSTKACLDLLDFCKEAKNLSTVVLRMDPLVPKLTSLPAIDSIVGVASSAGITRVRTSIVDYYPFVIEKFNKASLPNPGQLQPPPKVRSELLWALAGIVIGKYGMTLESCAESEDIPGMVKVGCADKDEWTKLGLDLEEGPPNRPTCFCNLKKLDLLRTTQGCGFNCLYCYWGKYR